jgi:hypothetical protein
MPTSPHGEVPTIYDVQRSFQETITCGNTLQLPRFTAAQNHLSEVLREHTRLLQYMETHGRPAGEGTDGAELEPACLVAFHAVYDSAFQAIRDSIDGLSHTQPPQQQQHNAAADLNRLICLLKCVGLLTEALGWVLQCPASPTQHTANAMSALQHRFGEESAQVAAMTPSSSSRASSVPEAEAVVVNWVRQAQTALSDLANYVSKTYPYGAWFGHRNRRAAVRSRRLRHPSDIGEGPFKSLVLASRSVEDDDITLLSAALLTVAQAHMTCLTAVRTTASRPTDPAALVELFMPLNNAMNELTATCEDVIGRREDDRPHAHAVLEAGNIFTWLTTQQEPCVVAEEAFGSANTYLSKITARGNVLLLQQESGFAVDRPDLTKAMVTWASMLREVLQRVMLMVVYRYPRHVPWGEMVETSMSRSQPRLPSEPRSGSREGQQQPVWRRAASASPNQSAPALPATSPPVPAPPMEQHHHQQQQQPQPASPPPPPSSVPPPPPPQTASSAAASAAPAEAAKDAAPAILCDRNPSPSCVFDTVTSTWTVQHYHQPLVSAESGAEQEPVFVVLPEDDVQQSHFVRIQHCFNTYVTVPRKVKGVAVEHCQHTKLQLAGAIGPVRITDTEKQEMLIEQSAPSVHATRVTGLILHLAGSHETEIITKLATDVNVNVMVEMADGDTEVRELALPAQFISTIGAGDVLHTKEVTYSG